MRLIDDLLYYNSDHAMKFITAIFLTNKYYYTSTLDFYHYSNRKVFVTVQRQHMDGGI